MITIGRLQQPWWYQERERLLALAAHSPCYVYHEPTLAVNLDQLAQCKSLDKLFYAMKANAHDAILQFFYTSGIGFESVSCFELAKIIKLFPDIDRRRLLFTPNFAPRSEYAQALDQGVTLTVDSLYPLRHWSELFTGRRIMLRFDPQQQQVGHHPHVSTSGHATKFGIHAEQLPELLDLLAQHRVQVVGLHCHTGSGILNPAVWQRSAEFLAQLLRFFPEAVVLNMGGGLGIVQQPQQVPLDLPLFDSLLSAVKQHILINRPVEFWLEPGRFLVAHAGVLLARVTQLKRKGGIHFVGIDTGMNSLIRPPLYGAHHEVVNLTRIDQESTECFTIVGPICETGDVMAEQRYLPPTEENDVLLILDVGAYGYVMSSHYNLREPAMEFYLN